MVQWQPQASPDALARRAAILADIRSFFAERNVLEVETPLLATATATDIHIQSFPVTTSGNDYFLQTSPEFAMKRLLASGSGSIYQVCKAFRLEEAGRLHNPEFTLLEWYRTGFSLEQLMDEVEQLLNSIVQCGDIPRVSYRELFQGELDIDPHQASLAQLQALSDEHLEVQGSNLDSTDFMQLLLAQKIEPVMPPYCFVYDFPVAQASLAAVQEDASGQPVARRFELIAVGMELANGYFELTDAAEQRRRFEADNAARLERGLRPYPVDEKLLAALEAGLPSCSGVALGIDRLVMLACGHKEIGDVQAFPAGRI